MRVTQQISPWTTWYVVIRVNITYFKCKDTCVSSVNKIHKNQNNRDKHQCRSNASSNYFCMRTCCLCKKKYKQIMILWITFHSEKDRLFNKTYALRTIFWLQNIFKQTDTKHTSNVVSTTIWQWYPVVMQITNVHQFSKVIFFQRWFHTVVIMLEQC